jgi:hypothetical protein
MNGHLLRMSKEVIVACLNVLCRYSLEQTVAVTRPTLEHPVYHMYRHKAFLTYNSDRVHYSQFPLLLPWFV